VLMLSLTLTCVDVIRIINRSANFTMLVKVNCACRVVVSNKELQPQSGRHFLSHKRPYSPSTVLLLP